jgi:hypothetical protein
MREQTKNKLGNINIAHQFCRVPSVLGELRRLGM